MGLRTLLCGDGPLAGDLADRLTETGSDVSVVEPSGLLDRAEAAARVDAAVADLGGLDLLVHVLSAPPTPTELVDLDTDDWAAAAEAPMAVGLHLLQVARPHLANGSRVVHVLPTSAMGGAPGFAATATAAEGLRALNKSAARQWGPAGITTAVVAVAPELALGPLAATEGAALADAALGGPGGAGQLAGLLEVLASPGAAFTTGSTIVADGGTWMAP